MKKLRCFSQFWQRLYWWAGYFAQKNCKVLCLRGVRHPEDLAPAPLFWIKMEIKFISMLHCLFTYFIITDKSYSRSEIQDLIWNDFFCYATHVQVVYERRIFQKYSRKVQWTLYVLFEHRLWYHDRCQNVSDTSLRDSLGRYTSFFIKLKHKEPAYRLQNRPKLFSFRKTTRQRHGWYLSNIITP